MPPPELMDELTEVEREEFFRMPNPGRRLFLERRFPEWWHAVEQGTGGRRPPWFDEGGPGRRPEPPPGRRPGPGSGPTLGELLEWLATLPEDERRALRDRPLREVLERHLGGGRGPGRGPPRGPRRRPGGGR